MINKNFLLFIFLFVSCFLYTQEKIVIGIASPYVFNDDVNTIFVNKQFIFEFLSEFDDKKFDIEIIKSNDYEQENDYLKQYKIDCLTNGIDFLIYSVIYQTKSSLVFKIILFHNSTDKIVLIRNYTLNENDIINEFLNKSCKDFSSFVNKLDLTKSVKLKKPQLDQVDKDVIDKKDYKNEFFVMNGFFKNSPYLMSFLSLYTGYAITPIKFFNIEGCVFINAGSEKIGFDFEKISIDKLNTGTYIAIHFFLQGVVEPSIGLRFELGYVTDHEFYFSLPIDFGLKIYFDKTNFIKINSSFQFTYFDINKTAWEKSQIVGIIIGYGKKF